VNLPEMVEWDGGEHSSVNQKQTKCFLCPMRCQAFVEKKIQKGVLVCDIALLHLSADKARVDHGPPDTLYFDVNVITKNIFFILFYFFIFFIVNVDVNVINIQQSELKLD
jgi:hypothetical protein